MQVQRSVPHLERASSILANLCSDEMMHVRNVEVQSRVVVFEELEDSALRVQTSE